MTLNAFRRVLWAKQAGRVRRFHCDPCGIEQSVGEHSFGVAMMLELILGDQCSHNLLRAALRHDLGEIFVGDVSATTKWNMELDLDAIEARAQVWMTGTGIALTELEQRALKAADVLDGMLTALDARIRGNMWAQGPYEAWHDYANRTNFFGLTSWARNRFCEVFNDIDNIWNQVCAGESHFLRSFTKNGFWESTEAVVVPGVLEHPGKRVAQKD